ncbi:MAG: TatD family hydrolase [Paludibacteraceae bacterium]|nr:TatD family hydrolase [Paludibacteraceae bacterium]
MIIDTHTHIFENEFDEDRSAVIQRAKDAGVGKMVLPNINAQSITRLKELADSDTNLFVPAMGLHPTEVNSDYKTELETIKSELFSGKYAAVGEIGMDLYWDKEFEKEQVEAFETQLDWAAELSLPALIHSRSSFKETVNAVKNSRCKKGIFHCFGGTLEEAEELLSLGDFLLGIGGVVTFKKSTLPDVLSNIDIKHIVLETDAPYLAPTPHRGKRNEPSYITEVAAALSKIFNLSIDEVTRITTENAANLFKIKL